MKRYLLTLLYLWLFNLVNAQTNVPHAGHKNDEVLQKAIEAIEK